MSFTTLQAGSYYIGENYGGGIIFYIDATGLHGILIPAPQATKVQVRRGAVKGTLIGGTGTAIGTGQANTTAIVNGCSTSGIAAQICDALVLMVTAIGFYHQKTNLIRCICKKILLT